MTVLDAAAEAPLAGERRLRVAVLNRVFARSGGGAESYSIALVEQLAAQHEIHVFAQQIDHSWPQVRYHRISSPGPKPRWINQLWFAWASWRATRAGFDIVHSHENTWHGNVQTVHVRPLRLNLLAGRQGWAAALRWLKVALSPRLMTYIGLEGARCSVKRGREIVAASESLRAEIAKAYPATRLGLKVITPGVQVAPQAPTARAQARHQWGIAEQATLLLFVANDYARKGLDALLQALALQPESVQLLVVGNPSQRLTYETKAQALGIGQRIVFTGALHDVTSAYAAADVLVHPTLEDSFGMVVLEAMAHGLPVVVSSQRYCGAAALLHDQENALVLEDPRDATALAAALQQLLQNTGLAQRLAVAGLQFAAQHSWAAVAEQYARLYAQVAQSSVP